MKAIVVAVVIFCALVEAKKISFRPPQSIRAGGFVRNDALRKSSLAQRITEPMPHTYLDVQNLTLTL